MWGSKDFMSRTLAPMYWVGQKVCLHFSVTSWGKTRVNFFGQLSNRNPERLTQCLSLSFFPVILWWCPLRRPYDVVKDPESFRFEFQLLYSLALWPWARNLISRLSFLICKMGFSERVWELNARVDMKCLQCVIHFNNVLLTYMCQVLYRYSHI